MTDSVKSQMGVHVAGEMKTQYRVVRRQPWEGAPTIGAWTDTTPGLPAILPTSAWSIEFRIVPLRCGAVAPFKLDYVEVACELVSHDSNNPPHEYELETPDENFTFTW